MADKHHSGKMVKKKQKELEKTQKESLGLPENCDLKSANSVIRFPQMIDKVREETIKQNGRIDAQVNALDKDSKEKKDYHKYEDNNTHYLNKTDNSKEGGEFKPESVNNSVLTSKIDAEHHDNGY